ANSPPAASTTRKGSRGLPMPSPTPALRRAAVVMLATLLLGNIAVIIAFPSRCANSPHVAIGGHIWIAGCSEP
ncbi:hypothetical protein, partial [Bradyrhizobium sp.]